MTGGLSALDSNEKALHRSALRSSEYLQSGDVASLQVERQVQDRLLDERAHLSGAK